VPEARRPDDADRTVRGYEHRFPLDCWRFYTDGMRALAAHLRSSSSTHTRLGQRGVGGLGPRRTQAGACADEAHSSSAESRCRRHSSTTAPSSSSRAALGTGATERAPRTDAGHADDASARPVAARARHGSRDVVRRALRREHRPRRREPHPPRRHPLTHACRDDAIVQRSASDRAVLGGSSQRPERFAPRTRIDAIRAQKPPSRGAPRGRCRVRRGRTSGGRASRAALRLRGGRGEVGGRRR
jgi:hypothetical protein